MKGGPTYRVASRRRRNEIRYWSITREISTRQRRLLKTRNDICILVTRRDYARLHCNDKFNNEAMYGASKSMQVLRSHVGIGYFIECLSAAICTIVQTTSVVTGTKADSRSDVHVVMSLNTGGGAPSVADLISATFCRNSRQKPQPKAQGQRHQCATSCPLARRLAERHSESYHQSEDRRTRQVIPVIGAWASSKAATTSSRRDAIPQPPSPRASSSLNVELMKPSQRQDD